MTAVFPIAYFGSIAYYQNLLKTHKENEEILFEQFETFPKKSLRNHCSVLSPDGILNLTVPLNKVNGSKTITKEVKVDYSTDWQKKHWRTFKTAYSSSPYFDHYGMEVEEIIFKKWLYLSDLNSVIFEKIKDWLQLPLHFQLTETYEKYPNSDYRNFSFELVGNETYQQVFCEKEQFVPNLSILDAIFNLGPMARKLLV